MEGNETLSIAAIFGSGAFSNNTDRLKKTEEKLSHQGEGNFYRHVREGTPGRFENHF